jgi:hypothetical protein
MNVSFKPFMQLLLLILDMLFLDAAYLLAQGIFPKNRESQQFMRYARFWMLINGGWILVAWVGDVYAIKPAFPIFKVLSVTPSACLECGLYLFCSIFSYLA